MYTMQDVLKSRSVEKKEIDKMDIWVYLVVRPVSFVLTWLLLKINMSAKIATLVSVLITVTSMLLVLTSKYELILGGLLLFNFWIVFDCVDGNIARVTKTSSVYGEFIDGVSGYIFTSILFLSLGFVAYRIENQSPMVIFLGGATAIVTILPRLVEHKAKNMFPWYYSDITTRKNYSPIYILGLNIAGMAGLCNPLYVVCFLMGGLTYYVYVYFVIHFFIALFSISKTLKKLNEDG